MILRNPLGQPLPIDSSKESPSSVWDFLKSAADSSGLSHPVEAFKGLLKLAADPMGAANDMGMQTVRGLQDAIVKYRAHDTQGAIRSATGAIPFVGPSLQRGQDQPKSGQYAGAAGTATGLIAPMFTGEAIDLAKKAGPAVEAAMSARAGRAAETLSAQQMADVLKAVPAAPSSPYNPGDLARAKPYLDAEHATSPIASVENLRDAADSSITQIEEHVHQAIAANPGDLIRTDPLASARAVLAQSPRTSAVTDGLKELTDLGLDKPITVAQADDIRLQLNAENKALLKKNQYDTATAAQVDPGFAARQAASNALREGIYGQLEQRGIDGISDLRKDEGSLLAIRNAAQRQIYSGDKTVSGTGSQGMAAQVAAGVARLGGTATGAYVGGPTGAVAGAVTGDRIADLIAKPNLSRDALVARAFAKSKGAPVNYPRIPPNAAPD